MHMYADNKKSYLGESRIIGWAEQCRWRKEAMHITTGTKSKIYSTKLVCCRFYSLQSSKVYSIL